MSKRVFNVLLGIASLSLGGALYLAFRPYSYISELVGTIFALEPLRRAAGRFSCEFLKYYFPDYLWTFSLSCGLIAIFGPKLKGVAMCCLTSFLLGVVWEILQFIGVVSGTGDILDVIMYLLAALTALLINFKEKKQ